MVGSSSTEIRTVGNFYVLLPHGEGFAIFILTFLTASVAEKSIDLTIKLMLIFFSPELIHGWSYLPSKLLRSPFLHDAHLMPEVIQGLEEFLLLVTLDSIDFWFFLLRST